MFNFGKKNQGNSKFRITSNWTTPFLLLTPCKERGQTGTISKALSQLCPDQGLFLYALPVLSLSNGSQ
jgi:hypothetical protein